MCVQRKEIPSKYRYTAGWEFVPGRHVSGFRHVSHSQVSPVSRIPTCRLCFHFFGLRMNADIWRGQRRRHYRSGICAFVVTDLVHCIEVLFGRIERQTRGFESSSNTPRLFRAPADRPISKRQRPCPQTLLPQVLAVSCTSSAREPGGSFTAASGLSGTR